MAWRFFWSLKYGGRYSLFVKTYTLQGTITYPVFNALLSRWVSFSQCGTCSLEGNWYTGIKNYIIHMVDRRKIGLSHYRGMIFPVFFAGKLSKRPLRQKGRVIWRKHVLCFLNVLVEHQVSMDFRCQWYFVGVLYESQVSKSCHQTLCFLDSKNWWTSGCT